MKLDKDAVVKGTKHRVSTIRARTWLITALIIVALVFYFLVTVITRDSISWFDFIVLCAVQIMTYFVYYPDGELFGQKDIAFQANKENYNEKATAINESRNIAKLRQYCKVEYEERKERYIVAQCALIGITVEELELFKSKTANEIKRLKTFEIGEVINGEEKSKLIVFSPFRRRKLYALLFKPLPVEENHPETIMSGIEINANKAIKDGSVGNKIFAYVRKFLMAVIVGAFFAYIGYAIKDGIGFAEITQIVMYVTTILSTAIFAYQGGERNTKVYKSRFYLELSNFIDSFNEWNEKNHIIIEPLTADDDIE